MATVSNTLRMNDSMGMVLRGVVTEMNRTIGTMERLDSTSDGIDLSSNLGSATASAAGLHRGLEPIDDDLRRAGQEQRTFNNRIRDGTTEANSLKKIIGALGGIYAGKEIITMSDSVTLIAARLALIKSDMETVNSLQTKIFLSASNARGLYTDMATSVAKLALLAGQSFNSNDEIIRFVNLFQKMGTVGGSSASEVSNAMYQLNQAMASGRLQGDEYRSIIENAPMLAKAIEDYMINVKGASGSMKDWASDGLLTADVIKAAMFSVADEVDEAFEKMPMTWGAVWNGIVNLVIQSGKPILSFINLLANNWSILEPIAVAGAIAIGGYVTALVAYKTASMVASLATAVHTAFTSGWTIATFQATLAQDGLNAALLACPITWIILAIMAVVAIFYAAIAATNKFAGTSLSATGIIVGAFFIAGALIGNVLKGLLIQLLGCISYGYNIIAAFANFFGNVFNDPIGAVIHLFGDFGDAALDVLESIAKSMDFLFGTHFQDTVSGWRASLQELTDVAAAKYGNGTYEQKMDKFSVDGALEKMGIDLKRFDYGDAWKKGNDIGASLKDKMLGLTGMGNEGIDTNDLTSSLADEEYDVNVKDDVSLADESLAYMLDAVTQKYVNKVNVTSPAPIVTVQFGDVHNGVDLEEAAEFTKKKIGVELVEYAMSSTDIKRG